jgi:hypothetical protein
MTKGTDPPFLNKDFLHHLNQFAIVQNLFDNMGVGLSVILTIRETTLPAHVATPLKNIIRLVCFFGKEINY